MPGISCVLFHFLLPPLFLAVTLILPFSNLVGSRPFSREKKSSKREFSQGHSVGNDRGKIQIQLCLNVQTTLFFFSAVLHFIIK